MVGSPICSCQREIGNWEIRDKRNCLNLICEAFTIYRWTMQMTSNLRFVFAEHDGQFMIQEQGQAGVSWSRVQGPGGEVFQDFAIVTRLLDAKTGQVVIAAAGLGSRGTQAAGEFISRPDYLEQAFGPLPRTGRRKTCR
jgi:hypothetical protein